MTNLISFPKARWLGSALAIVLIAGGLKLALAITAFTPAVQPTGWVAQDELTNYNLRSGNERLFRVEYEKEFWSGNLLSYKMDAAGDLSASPQDWKGGAAEKLDNQLARLIVTMKSDGSRIPFLWGSLSGTQQTDITSETILNFVRGDRTKEIQQQVGTLRTRASALGDIIHSRPWYVDDVTNPTVFVGANDGMLHAFNATTGEERWAYIPSMLIAKLKNLATNPYVHDYYVDGSVNVATILSGSKRVLVGMLGAGGKGVYALDITGSGKLAPADDAAAATNILWEITPTTINNAASASYANLGFTYGLSTIVKMASTDTVVLGNGYNNGGDYQARLYLVNANTGALIASIPAGTSGTAASPNGLSTPTVIDSNNDGEADTAYAGDLNGTLWKFNLSARTATALLVTSPAQPITTTPAAARHPGGGFMVNFATGSLFTPADTDTTVFAAYGIWDGAPVANTALLAQTLTERCYTKGTVAIPSPCTSRVRTVSDNQPDWTPFTSGTAKHKGWRVPLPAGERVLGDGSFIENGRFYFSSHNPTITTTVATTTIRGENWLMELDFLTGAAKNSPFLDLSGDVVLDNDDRVKDTTTRAPVTTLAGIPVGKFISTGVQSNPVLVQLSSLNNTLFNQNPDVLFAPVPLTEGSGVTGGHFDVDLYYGSTTGGAQATATINVGTVGQTSGYPATLGAITVDGVTVIPALTTFDITDGPSSGPNANMIASKVTNGFTAKVTGSTVTLTAPLGAVFNGKSIVVGAGTTATLVPPITGVAPTGLISFTGGPTAGSGTVTINKTLNSNASTIILGALSFTNAITIGTNKTALQAAASVASAIGTGGTLKAYVGSNAITTICKAQPKTVVCLVNTATYANGEAVQVGTRSNFGTMTVATTASAGGVTPVTRSGWTNLATAITTTAFTNAGAEPTAVGNTCTSANCQSNQHFHQYDDKFDVTGVNALNPSSTTLDLKLAIASLRQPFKVVAQNQYLSPSVKLHIGDPSYLFNVDFGYIRLKDYTAAATLDLATLQTYQRNPGTVWPGAAATAAARLAAPKFIGSLVMNMPVDALTAKDWWGNGDVRVGLHPTVTGCVNKAKSVQDGNMYQPVIPPANGTNGPGALGYSGSTTQATATGVRHNGALTVAIIRDTTPNSAMELSVPGRPEYGWRVKASLNSTYVLAEYTLFWHHTNGKCYGDAGWTKTPTPDASSSRPDTKAPGSTDPKLGDLSGGLGGSGGTVVGPPTITTVGNVTTTVISYTNGTTATIVRTANDDGSVTIVTTDAAGVRTEQTIANKAGSLRSGGDERGLQARTGRISWREIIRP